MPVPVTPPADPVNVPGEVVVLAFGYAWSSGAPGPLVTVSGPLGQPSLEAMVILSVRFTAVPNDPLPPVNVTESGQVFTMKVGMVTGGMLKLPAVTVTGMVAPGKGNGVPATMIVCDTTMFQLCVGPGSVADTVLA